MGANFDRDQWFDLLCTHTLRLAGEHADVARGYLPIEARPDLGAATLLAWICDQADRATTTVDIVERLLASGSIAGQERERLVELVRRVRVKRADVGLPIADWWDTQQLLATMLAYLAPRIALAHDGREAARHLRTVFGLTSAAVIEDLVAGPIDPPALPTDVSYLPPAQARGAADGSGFLRALAARPEVHQEIAEIRSRTLIGGGGAPRLDTWQRTVSDGTDAWLADGHAVVCTWGALRDVVRAISTDPELRDALGRFADLDAAALPDAVSIIEDASDRCEAWLNGLTATELTLIRRHSTKELRRRHWLDGHMAIKHVPVLLPDSVPDTIDPDATAPTPAWTKSLVFERGARFFHQPAGAIVLWFGVVDSDEDERNLMVVRTSPPRMIVAEDRETVVVDIAIAPGDIRQAALAPFRFFPDHLNGAVEVVLTSLAGARLDWYRLRDGRDLEHLYAWRLTFPAQALQPLLDRADAAIERAELDEPELAVQHLLLRELLAPDQDQAMFVGTDNAKSEAVLLELELATAGSNPEVQAAVAARATLAAAELARVSVEVDGEPSKLLTTAVDDARSAYRVCRQQLHKPAGRTFRDVLANVTSTDRAFVQFAEAEGYLSALIAHRPDSDPQVRFVDLSHVQTEVAREVSDVWLGHVGNGPWEQIADALDGLLHWVGNQLIAPILEELDGSGIRHLVLCPSRALEPIPLHAAPIDGVPLADVIDVSYAPSAAVLARLSAMPTHPSRLDLIVAASGADAPASAGLRAIAGPDQEARLLQALEPNARLLGGLDAEPGTVVDAIANSHVAHLAAHGRAQADELASGLWLAGGTPAQALLSAARVHAGPALQKTSLVVLSACESARHPEGGAGIQTWRGLDSAFLSRGARAVVGSLWRVADTAALVYSAVLHGALARGTTIVGAHSAATAALRVNAVDSRSAALLDSVRPTWRNEIRRHGIDRAYWWSAYRPSGICW